MYNNDPMGVVSSDRHLDPPGITKKVQSLLEQMETAKENMEELKMERDELLRDMRCERHLTPGLHNRIADMIADGYDDLRDKIIDITADYYDSKIAGRRVEINACNYVLSQAGEI